MVFEVHGKVYNWAWFCQQLVFCVFSHLCCRCHDIVKLFSLFLLSTSGNKLFGFTTQFTNSQILARKFIEKLYVHFRSFCAWASLNRRHSDFYRYRFLFGFRLQNFLSLFLLTNKPFWAVDRRVRSDQVCLFNVSTPFCFPTAEFTLLWHRVEPLYTDKFDIRLLFLQIVHYSFDLFCDGSWILSVLNKILDFFLCLQWRFFRHLLLSHPPRVFHSNTLDARQFKHTFIAHKNRKSH